MWRVDDQDEARAARLLALRSKNERYTLNRIPVDYIERINKATHHISCSGNGSDHRQFSVPPPELYLKYGIPSCPLPVLDLTSLPVASDWLQIIVRDLQPSNQSNKLKEKASAMPSQLLLTDTGITDAGFAPIQRLKHLRVIHVSRCASLTDASLKLIRRQFSSSLEELDISECRHFTSDVLCQLWRDCYRMKTLRAHGCPAITDTFLQCVAVTRRPGQTEGLKELDISHCKNVTSSGISHLATSSLSTINFSSLRLNDCLEVDNMAFFGFENSPRLQDVVHLDLSGLRVDETGISWIAKGCKQVEHLNLSRCRLLNDFSLLLLSPLLSNKLKRLDMKQCVLISDEGMKNLFSIEESKVTEEGHDADDDDDGDNAVSLQVLNIEGCTLIGDATFNLLGKHCGRLRKINARGLRKVSDAGILALAKGCPQLASLKLSGRHITDQTFKILGKICPRLYRLDLSDRLDLESPLCFVSLTASAHRSRLTKVNFASTNICDVGVSILATQLPNLTCVNLSKCLQVSDIGVEALAYCCHSIQVLLLSNTKAVTDRSLTALAMMRPPLRIVDLCGNTNITDAGVLSFAASCQRIQELRLSGCERLSFQTIQRLGTLLPLTKTPVAPTLSQKLATGGPTGANAILHPLPGHHIHLVQSLVAQYQSACVLQSQFRRWKHKGESALFLARRRFLRETRAARKIQRCIRAFLHWRRYLRHLQLSRNVGFVVAVQAHARGNQSRFRTRVWRFTVTHAAKTIQRGFRPHHVTRMKIRTANTLTIQRVYRGYLGRVAYRSVVLEHRRECGKKIWDWYRRCLHHRQARARARWLVAKIHNIQGQWRVHKRRVNFRKYLRFYRCQAVHIQRVWRGHSTRRRVARLRIEWTEAAIVIQRVYRAHRIRCIVIAYRLKANASCTSIQTSWRRYKCHKLYQRHRRLIVHSQRMARYAMAVYKLRRTVYAALAKHRNDAAAQIQRVYRGHLGRRRVLLFRKIRNAVYAKKGQNATQAWLRQGFIRRGAAIRIQRCLRRYFARRKMIKLRKWRRYVASRCIQRYMKAWVRRLGLRRKREMQTHAAITAQRVYRGHLGRVAFKQEHHRQACLKSARLIQRVYRGYKARCYFKSMRKEMIAAARRLQRAYRGRNTRKLYEISMATAALKAKEKYDKSLLGMLDAKRNPMDELYRRAKLPHEKETLQKLHGKWEANRLAQERAVRKLAREYKQQVWPGTEEVVANHLAVRKKLYGVTENVYVTHKEHDERVQLQAELKHELVDLHTRIFKCQQALREAVATRRMLDGDEILEILRSYRLVDEAPSNNQVDA